MGNLLACFGKPKKEAKSPPGRNGKVRGVSLLEQLETEVPEPAGAVAGFDPVTKTRDQQLNLCSPKKKVTFDLNVRTYTEVAASESLNSSVDADNQKLQNKKGDVSSTKDGPETHTSGYRYQNCADCDDEEIEDEGEAFDVDDDEAEIHEEELLDCGHDEESYDAYFSTQHDDWQVKKVEVSDLTNAVAAKCDTSPNQKVVKHFDIDTTSIQKTAAKEITRTSNNVIRPLENLLQSRGTKWSQKKENVLVEEVSVDTSLSSWLTPKTTPVKSSSGSVSLRSRSPTSLDERPILGALTVEDIKNSATPSPRKSPTKSPDEMPIIGNVGGYWNDQNQEADSHQTRSSGHIKGIPNTTSKYREDKRVNWHSTPFEVRLERALNKESTGAYSSSIPPSTVC